MTEQHPLIEMLYEELETASQRQQAALEVDATRTASYESGRIGALAWATTEAERLLEDR